MNMVSKRLQVNVVLGFRRRPEENCQESRRPRVQDRSTVRSGDVWRVLRHMEIYVFGKLLRPCRLRRWWEDAYLRFGWLLTRKQADYTAFCRSDKFRVWLLRGKWAEPVFLSLMECLGVVMPFWLSLVLASYYVKIGNSITFYAFCISNHKRRKGSLRTTLPTSPRIGNYNLRKIRSQLLSSVCYI